MGQILSNKSKKVATKPVRSTKIEASSPSKNSLNLHPDLIDMEYSHRPVTLLDDFASGNQIFNSQSQETHSHNLKDLLSQNSEQQRQTCTIGRDEVSIFSQINHI